MGDGGRPVNDWTEALFEADVERFLKNGILESSFEGCCAGDGGEEEDVDAELSLNEPNEVSEPVWDSMGVSDLAISPKYCSVSLTAS